jgi:hypothetical protein
MTAIVRQIFDQVSSPSRSPSPLIMSAYLAALEFGVASVLAHQQMRGVRDFHIRHHHQSNHHDVLDLGGQIVSRANSSTVLQGIVCSGSRFLLYLISILRA